MKKKLKNILDLFKTIFKEYSQDDTWVLGAALSYYTVFSLAPILIIVIAVAGMIYGREAVTGQIYGQVSQFIGHDAALQVQEMVKSAYDPGKSTIATIIAVALLIFGATTVFYQLQSALNKIWEVKPEPKQGLLMYIKDRVLSFSLIIAIGFVLLVSLVVNAAMVGLTKYLMSFLPEYSIYLFQVIDFVLSLGIITVLFALIYRFLPDAIVRWRDVWIGSAFTALLFTLGRIAISWYLGTSDVGSTYGAAGSVVVILLWVSYSSQILFFGAEFTQVYAQRYGTPIQPAPYAKRIKMVPVEQKENESADEFEDKVQDVQEVCETGKPVYPDELEFKLADKKETYIRPEKHHRLAHHKDGQPPASSSEKEKSRSS